MIIYHLRIKAVKIHKKTVGVAYMGGRGSKSPPLSTNTPFPSDSVPLSFTNCLPPKTDPAGRI